MKVTKGLRDLANSPELRPATPPPLPFFTDENVSTMIGMPAPLHLPGVRARRSYVERYPPQIDEPVVIELVNS